MPTKSKFGTITWVDPEFHISYDSVSGRILSVGLPLELYPSFKITVDEAISFTSGKLLTDDYRVIKEGDQCLVVKKDYDSVVSRTYPVKATVDVFPKVKIVRNNANQNWVVSKIVDDPVFIFVCKKKSSQHYIRTLNILEKDMTIPMIYTSEQGEVDLYTQEHYSIIEFHDQ